MLIEAQIAGMKSWRGLHPARYRVVASGRRGVEKKRHAQWRWGKKKGLRRARRRLAHQIIATELHRLE